MALPALALDVGTGRKLHAAESPDTNIIPGDAGADLTESIWFDLSCVLPFEVLRRRLRFNPHFTVSTSVVCHRHLFCSPFTSTDEAAEMSAWRAALLTRGV